jgi:hypothetical protein
MMPVEVNQIRMWNSKKYPSHMELYGLMFIVIKENQLHELDDEPTCDIKYLSQTMKGLVIKQYCTGFVERNSEIVNENQ